ncbi:PREDICTED: cytochrome c oxidase subunit 6B-like [Atta colombica]|uniref:cytochrome c oxidase subunit 6B-like n=1 Tax=Atta colombica TaxID=520822 RepID=UPI00084C2424|nr:PREDICTED: cytochrome c oxidase subunit 6B-like [Atta colombica]
MENNSASTRKNEMKNEKSKKKITIEVDEDDPFQQANQTLRCFVMYTDFYRCEHILGKSSEACTWFKDAFTTICPKAWVEQWDELRTTGRLPWQKYRTQGEFPGNKYGE